MKSNLKIITVILIIAVLSGLMINSLNAQERVSIGVYQDARLGLLGDDKGNPAGTLNLLVRLEMQGHQRDYGFLTVTPEFETARIKGGYNRYSANVGYTFIYIIKNTEQNIALGYGFIDRSGTTFRSFSATAKTLYRVNDRLKIGVLAQLVDRKDLKVMYGNNAIRFSGFVGVEYNLN